MFCFLCVYYGVGFWKFELYLFKCLINFKLFFKENLGLFIGGKDFIKLNFFIFKIIIVIFLLNIFEKVIYSFNLFVFLVESSLK